MPWRHTHHVLLFVGMTALALAIGPGDLFAQALDNTTFDTDVSGWTPAADSTLAWDPLDADASPTSGSALVTNLSNTEVDSTGPYQCTDGILEAGKYAISAEAFIPSAQTESGLANIIVFWYAEPSCSTLLDLAVSSNVLASTPDLWLPVSGWLTAPAGSQSARIRPNVLKVEDTGSLAAHFDNVCFAEGIFADGFESVDTSAWSDTVGLPGLISFISLQVTPGTVLPGGTGTDPLELLALVKDDFGLGVPGAPVNFITEAGSLASGGAVIPADSEGQVRDLLTVTAADIVAHGTSTFVVRAQTVDFSGSQIEATFLVRILLGHPIADFTYVVNVLNVDFLNHSTGNAPLSCTWQFGDGFTLFQPLCEDVQHIYGTPGSYQVTLTVTNDLGSDSIPKTVVVTY